MSTDKLDIAAKRKRSDIAHKVYQALVAQDPDRVITLCDGDGRVVTRHEPRTEQDAAESAS